MTRLLIAAATAALLAPAAEAQTRREVTSDSLNLRQEMRAGSWLRVMNMNGEISVEAASGNVAEVVGVKRYRRGDPADVRFEILQEGNDVTVCALWGDRSSCDMDRMESNYRGGRDNDVSVDFTVRLPRGVKVKASSVNGSVDVAGAGAEVQASTVNGGVDVSTSVGPVTAKTVNGNVVARMTTLPEAADMEFSTVNGSVRVLVPNNFDAEIEMRTVNGRLRTDFPMTLSGRIDPRRLNATIGKGGRKVTLKTVNGSIDLQRQG